MNPGTSEAIVKKLEETITESVPNRKQRRLEERQAKEKEKRRLRAERTMNEALQRPEFRLIIKNIMAIQSYILNMANVLVEKDVLTKEELVPKPKRTEAEATEQEVT